MKVSGQLHAPIALSLRKGAPGTHWIRDCPEPKAGLDTVVKRKIPTPCQDLKPPIIQPVDQRYTTELSRLLINNVIIN
jgi:hypothetical protein